MSETEEKGEPSKSVPSSTTAPTADTKRIAALKGKFDLEDEEMMEQVRQAEAKFGKLPAP